MAERLAARLAEIYERITKDKMKDQSTHDTLMRRYHSLKHGRHAAVSSATRHIINASFRRTLGAWLPARSDAAILDVGCGEGALLSFLTEAGFVNLAGFDLSPENVEICNGRGLGFVRQHDALSLLTFTKDSKWNLILCLDLLEHLPKDNAVAFLKDARSVLAEGGQLIIQTPNMGSILGLFHRYDDLTHSWGLTEFSARDLLVASGFKTRDIEIRPAWNATTLLGRLREIYLRLIHICVFLAEGARRPRIPTKNLLIRVTKR